MSVVVDLSAPGRLGFLVQGSTADDRAGSSVSSAGDFNGDGLDDFIIGVPGGDAGGSDSGEAYVIFGNPDGFGTLDETDIGEAGFVIRGASAFDGAGCQVSYAGDVNGDGLGDLIVLAPGGDAGGDNATEAYVIFGTTAAIDTIDLANLDGAGFLIHGDNDLEIDIRSASSAGDVNGDGFDDLLLGAPDSNGGDGGIFIILGKESGFQTVDLSAPGSAGFSIRGADVNGSFGSSVFEAGDVNGDGLDDIIVRSSLYDGYERISTNQAYVIFGRADGLSDTDLDHLDASEGFLVESSHLYGSISVVSSAGDVNGDGFEDVVIGETYSATRYSPAGGSAYVIFGGPGAFESIDLRNIDSSTGFVIRGGPRDQAGSSVRSTGDVNGDGYDDIIVGAPLGDDGGRSAGEAYVIFGGAAPPGRISLDQLAPGVGFIVQGDAGYDNAGSSVSSAGDINGDGFADIIVGAPGGDNGGNSAGEAYVIYGGTHFGPVILSGSSAGEQLTGGLADDRLEGGGGDDFLEGWAANDYLDGGDGIDTVRHELADAGVAVDLRIEGPQDTDGAGTDTLISIENIIGSSFNDRLIGSGGANSLAGGDGDDLLEGGDGDDVLDGGYGVDAVSYANASSAVWAVLKLVGPQNTLGAGIDTLIGIEALYGSAFDDVLEGNAGDNLLSGGAGDDLLRGNEGNDRLFGGDGNDIATYVGADAGVLVRLNTIAIQNTVGAGFDILFRVEGVIGSAFDDHLIGNDRGNLLNGSDGDDRLEGGAGSDRLQGGAGNDILDGGGGADIARGGLGDDIYFVDNVNDAVLEGPDSGRDTVHSSVNYVLNNTIENLVLAGSAVRGSGNGLANRITGNATDNILNGGGGADTMRGLGGDDTYHVDASGDRVLEQLDRGIDTVRSTVSFALAANIERLILSGMAVRGNGNALDNVIIGNAAENILNGGAGADTMRGGGGDDVYVVDNSRDRALEALSAGHDTVLSSASHALAGNVEALVLIGAASINGTGNDTANDLRGNSGDNRLNGRGGNDSLDGMAGDDRLLGGDGADQLMGAVGDDTLWGEAGNDLIWADIGNDILSGGSGNDRIFGGAGRDRMTGGSGADRFQFDSALDPVTNVDTILDFVVPDDTIMLDRAIFSAIAADGPLAASDFHVGIAAADASDRIIYNSGNGNIFYDIDGIGGAHQVLFARVTPGTSLTRLDFIAYSTAPSAAAALFEPGGVDASHVLSLAPYHQPSVLGPQLLEWHIV